jgi:CSLREA domain-containing protein
MRVQKHTRRWTQASAKGGYASGIAAAALLGAVTLALLVWLVVMPATRVQAATYTVNSIDDVDDGACNSIHCSLREAIKAANATVDDDVIAIGVTGPIVLLGDLPAIKDDDLIITGGGARVSLTAPGTAFSVDADRVQISNLIIDGENVGTTGIQISVTTDDLVLDGLTVRGFNGDGFDNGPGGGGTNNLIRNSTFTSNGGNGIDFNGGKDNVVQGNVITNNGDGVADDDGLEVSFEDNLLIQGNTFSGNDDAQILIGDMAAGQRVSIIQNTITSGSDGIVVGALVNAAAEIDIGLSFDNRNVFRGIITANEQHLRNLSHADIDAIYNDWDAYNPAAIEGVICHDGDPGCGPGVVDFKPFIDAPSPLETPTPTVTPTETPGAATETPTPPATATPGGVETLPLIAGCTPLAWTGGDNTPVATIVGAVSPPGILVALWEFEVGVWLGYSPQFPDVSDLTEKDRLDVVFVCVSTGGTFSRPVI